MRNEVERIKERYNPSDNMGIGHPIHEEELSKDIMYLANELEEAQTLIKKLYNLLGSNADSDHRLWRDAQDYCLAKNLTEKKSWHK